MVCAVFDTLVGAVLEVVLLAVLDAELLTTLGPKVPVAGAEFETVMGHLKN